MFLKIIFFLIVTAAAWVALSISENFDPLILKYKVGDTVKIFDGKTFVWVKIDSLDREKFTYRSFKGIPQVEELNKILAKK